MVAEFLSLFQPQDILKEKVSHAENRGSSSAPGAVAMPPASLELCLPLLHPKEPTERPVAGQTRAMGRMEQSKGLPEAGHDTNLGRVGTAGCSGGRQGVALPALSPCIE